MIALMELGDWVTRLIDECPSFAGRIFKTVPDDELTIDLTDSPAAFVYLSDDSSDENRLKIGIRQKMTSQVSVEIIIRRAVSLSDRFNDGTVDQIKTLREEVFNALAGFEPSQTVRDVAHVGGTLKSRDARLIKWVDTFATHTLIQSSF